MSGDGEGRVPDIFALAVHDRPTLDTREHSSAAQEVFEFLCQCGHPIVDAEQLDRIREAGAGFDDERWKAAYAAATEHGMGQLVYAHAAAAGLLSAMPLVVAASFAVAYSRTLLANRQL